MRLLDVDTSKVLARKVLSAEGVTRMSVVARGADGKLYAHPFEREIASTVWADSQVAVLHHDTLTDFLLDDLEMMVRRKASDEEIADYLKSSSLLARLDDQDPILLQL